MNVAIQVQQVVTFDRGRMVEPYVDQIFALPEKVGQSVAGELIATAQVDGLQIGKQLADEQKLLVIDHRVGNVETLQTRTGQGRLSKQFLIQGQPMT